LHSLFVASFGTILLAIMVANFTMYNPNRK
jgi:hypothetical protein